MYCTATVAVGRHSACPCWRPQWPPVFAVSFSSRCSLGHCVCWTDWPACVDEVISLWRQTAPTAANKGVHCAGCCEHVISRVFHHECVHRVFRPEVAPPKSLGTFYEKDRRPASAGEYDKFQAELGATEKTTEYFLSIQCP